MPAAHEAQERPTEISGYLPGPPERKVRDRGIYLFICQIWLKDLEICVRSAARESVRVLTASSPAEAGDTC